MYLGNVCGNLARRLQRGSVGAARHLFAANGDASGKKSNAADRPSRAANGRRDLCRGSLGRQQAGFSLIEVLVSLVVVAVGMLGLTGLLVNGVAATKTSQLRSAASLQVTSLASAMSTNRDFWGDPDLAQISFTAEGTVVKTQNGINLGVAPDCLAAACNAHNLAVYDIKNWLTALDNQLPDAKSEVQCSIHLDAKNCYATVKWNENYYAGNKTGTSKSAATGGERRYSQFITP